MENFSFLACQKYSVVLLETEIPKIFYLKHHRAESEVWTSELLCDSCILIYKRVLKHYGFGYAVSNTCKCNVCSRQPLSLESLTSHVFNFVYNLDQFQLTSKITPDQYVFAFNSKTLPCEQLLRKFISDIVDINFRFKECTLHVACFFNGRGNLVRC